MSNEIFLINYAHSGQVIYYQNALPFW